MKPDCKGNSMKVAMMKNFKSRVSQFLLALMVVTSATIAHSAEEGAVKTQAKSTTAMESLQASEIWSPETPPHIKSSAIYLKLKNMSAAPLTITGISSPQFAMVHFHKTITENGMSKMEPVHSLTLAAKQEIEFKPGNMHIMLMGAKNTFKVGDEIPIELQTIKGQKFEFSAIVKKRSFPSQNHSNMQGGK